MNRAFDSIHVSYFGNYIFAQILIWIFYSIVCPAFPPLCLVAFVRVLYHSRWAFFRSIHNSHLFLDFEQRERRVLRSKTFALQWHALLIVPLPLENLYFLQNINRLKCCVLTCIPFLQLRSTASTVCTFMTTRIHCSFCQNHLRKTMFGA